VITATLHSFRGHKPDISPQKIHETNEEWGWGPAGLGTGGVGTGGVGGGGVGGGGVGGGRGWGPTGLGPDNDRQASRAAAAAFSGPALVADEGLEVPLG
jgi:hypothetical protein